MLRNKLSIIVYIVLLSITCVNLVACGNNDVNYENKNFVHDATKWFTEEELSTKGLAGLTAPTNENWYIIEPKEDLSDYFDNNPSKLYKFYYVRNNTLNNGYFIKDSVWIFEIRYEFDTNSDEYKFKLFIESADSSRNGIYMNYYKMS